MPNGKETVKGLVKRFGFVRLYDGRDRYITVDELVEMVRKEERGTIGNGQLTNFGSTHSK